MLVKFSQTFAVANVLLAGSESLAQNVVVGYKRLRGGNETDPFYDEWIVKRGQEVMECGMHGAVCDLYKEKRVWTNAPPECDGWHVQRILSNLFTAEEYESSPHATECRFRHFIESRGEDEDSSDSSIVNSDSSSSSIVSGDSSSDDAGDDTSDDTSEGSAVACDDFHIDASIGSDDDATQELIKKEDRIAKEGRATLSQRSSFQVAESVDAAWSVERSALRGSNVVINDRGENALDPARHPGGTEAMREHMARNGFSKIPTVFSEQLWTVADKWLSGGESGENRRDDDSPRDERTTPLETFVDEKFSPVVKAVCDGMDRFESDGSVYPTGTTEVCQCAVVARTASNPESIFHVDAPQHDKDYRANWWLTWWLVNQKDVLEKWSLAAWGDREVSFSDEDARLLVLAMQSAVEFDFPDRQVSKTFSQEFHREETTEAVRDARRRFADCFTLVNGWFTRADSGKELAWLTGPLDRENDLGYGRQGVSMLKVETLERQGFQVHRSGPGGNLFFSEDVPHAGLHARTRSATDCPEVDAPGHHSGVVSNTWGEEVARKAKKSKGTERLTRAVGPSQKLLDAVPPAAPTHDSRQPAAELRFDGPVVSIEVRYIVVSKPKLRDFFEHILLSKHHLESTTSSDKGPWDIATLLQSQEEEKLQSQTVGGMRALLQKLDLTHHQLSERVLAV